MRQILQSLRDGRTALVEVPAPVAGRGALLIRSSCSLISAGTERMLLEFGRAGWLDNDPRATPPGYGLRMGPGTE